MVRPLAEALKARPLFFEPVPPTARSSPARAEATGDELVRILERSARVDAVDVPELVDENHDGRPYYRSGDTRGFAARLAQRTGREVVVNKVVAHLPSVAAVGEWAADTVRRGIRHVVLVGGSSRYIPYPGPTVVEADRICRAPVEAAGGLLGNIAIPQRTGEAHRMLSKTRAGAAFFTTQILFDGAAAARMVREYDLLCRAGGIPPSPVLLSVAPIADEGDAEFARWLGADISESAERAILNGDDTDASARSVERALAVYREVRTEVVRDQLAVGLGVNVEQISQRHLGAAAEMLAAFSRVIDDPAG